LERLFKWALAQLVIEAWRREYNEEPDSGEGHHQGAWGNQTANVIPLPAHFRPEYCLVSPETRYLPNLDAFIKIRVVLQIFLAITAHFNQACSRALPLWAAI
jgi:hypothetical protein